FVDKNAEFIFVPANNVMDEAQRLGAIPFDVGGVELGHHGKECSFEAIVKKYGLTADPALILLGKIVNGADTDNSLWNQRCESKSRLVSGKLVVELRSL